MSEEEFSEGLLRNESPRDGVKFDRFAPLPPDFKPRQPLPDDEFQELRGKLRPEGKIPTVVQLPPPGTDLVPFLRDQLPLLGYDQTQLKKRVVHRDRLQQALMSGTDRDSGSELDYHGGDDGERLAMVENGLKPNSDGGLVTYVSDLDLNSDKPWMRPDSTSFAALIYAPDAIQYIQPSANRTGSFSNGFAMFADRRLVQPSLLAVLSPVSRAELLRQGEADRSAGYSQTARRPLIDPRLKISDIKLR